MFRGAALYVRPKTLPYDLLRLPSLSFMKLFPVIAILVFTSSVIAQSGRHATPPLPTPSPEQKPVEAPLRNPSTEQTPQVTAEKNQDYRCTDDGTLARILDSESGNDKGFLPKEVDTRAEVTSRPNPKYTREARRAGVQGNVVLKVLLGSKGDIGRVRVARRLPFGLTETAIEAACQIKFKPAIKDSQAVAQWFTVEYTFRLADSSILRP